MNSYLCPICRSESVKLVEGTQGLMICCLCSTTDSLAQFRVEPAEKEPGEKIEIDAFDPTAIFPPDNIIDAVETIDLYFRVQRRAKQWAFGPVQSRDEPALIGVEHVRNMALAFGYDLTLHVPFVKQTIPVDPPSIPGHRPYA